MRKTKLLQTTPQFGTTSSTVSATRSEPPSNFAITAGMSNVRNQAARRVHPNHTSSPRSVQVPGIGVATQVRNFYIIKSVNS